MNAANSIDASMSASAVGSTGLTNGTPNGRATLSEGGFGTDPNTDHWEFPRHRLKFFNILGEGAFGQVWRCEATGLAGKYSNFKLQINLKKDKFIKIC